MQILDSILLCLTVLVYPAAWMAMPGEPVVLAQAEAVAAPADTPPQPAEPPAATDAPAPAEPNPETPATPAPEESDEDALANTPARPVELQDVMEEVSELRAQVLQLQQTLDTWMETSLADLKAENETLRRQLREIHKTGGVDVPPVPTPEGDLLRDALAEPDTEPAPPPAPEVIKAVAAGGYFTVAEWGASPEDAAKSTPPRASLKGLIAVVLPGTAEEDLRELGKRLREEFKDYDNINIEFFDDRAAAEAFKSGQPVDSARRVLSVSRHKASGRDVVLLLKGNNALPVPVPLEEP